MVLCPSSYQSARRRNGPSDQEDISNVIRNRSTQSKKQPSRKTKGVSS